MNRKPSKNTHERERKRKRDYEKDEQHTTKPKKDKRQYRSAESAH